MPRKRVDLQKQKQQRQKVFVIIGGVVLLLAFAFEAKTLGLLGGKKAAEAPPVAAPAGTPTTPNSLTPPSLPDTTGTPSPVSTSTGDSGLADTDPQVSASSGQLASFTVFETKNPFVPQVDTGDGSSSTPAAGDADHPTDTTGDTPPATSGDVPPPGTSVTPTGGGTDAGGTAGTGDTGGTGTTPASGGTTGTTTTGTSTSTATVTISVNGHTEKVGRDGTFPADSPVFRLVSFSKGKAEIGIVGGSYQTGTATLTLEQGKTVTLMNTSDDKRYKLVLLATP